MEISEVLKNLGMNSIEQKIYTTLLAYNNLSSGSLAKLINRPRSTIYDILEKMKQKKFIIKTQEPYRATYSAINADKITIMLKAKEEKIKKTIKMVEAQKHLFKVFESNVKFIPQIRIYEGIESVELFQSNTKFDRGYFIRDIEALHNGLGRNLEEIIKKFKNKCQKNQKSIMLDTKMAREYKKQIEQTKNNTHIIKFFPKSKKILKSDSMIINGKYYHITYEEPVIAIEITNKVFFKTQKLIFETLRESLK